MDMLRAEQPDTVIVATGAVVETPPIPGVEQRHVLTGALLRQVMAGNLLAPEAQRLPGWQQSLLRRCVPVLQRVMTPGLLRRVSHWWMPVGKRVVIIGSDLAAIELAEFLARRGRKVQVVDSATKIIPEVGKKRRHEHMDRLDAQRVTLNTAVAILRIEHSAVIIQAGGKERAIPCDSVIVAGDVRAETGLADALGDAGLEVRTIGDATGLGLIVRATSTAAEAVASL